MNIKSYLVDLYTRFQSDEEGLALTEYLILLGLLTAAVVLAVLAFGEALGIQWALWDDFIRSLPSAPVLSTS